MPRHHGNHSHSSSRLIVRVSPFFEHRTAMKTIAPYTALLALLALSTWSCGGLTARRTGFLSDYSGLEEVESDVWFYVNPRP